VTPDPSGPPGVLVMMLVTRYCWIVTVWLLAVTSGGTGYRGGTGALATTGSTLVGNVAAGNTPGNVVAANTPGNVAAGNADCTMGKVAGNPLGTDGAMAGGNVLAGKLAGKQAGIIQVPVHRCKVMQGNALAANELDPADCTM
jgi:hypothetical protein